MVNLGLSFSITPPILQVAETIPTSPKRLSHQGIEDCGRSAENPQLSLDWRYRKGIYRDSTEGETNSGLKWATGCGPLEEFTQPVG